MPASMTVRGAAKEVSMTVNISGMSERELKRQIIERCSEFGSVNSVEIQRSETPASYRFAVVRMSTLAEASNLFTEWGTSMHGDSVTIRLEQSYS